MSQRKEFVCQVKHASKAKETIDISSSSGDGPTQSSDSEGSDESRRNRSSRPRKQVDTAAAASSPSDSDESSEDGPSEYESGESDDLQMSTKDYVVPKQCHLTEEMKNKIDAFVGKLQPKIPVLVVMLKRTNVQHYPDLVIYKDYAIKHFPGESKMITLKLPGKSKDWQCKFCIRTDGRRNLYLRHFVRDNRLQERELCLLQPVTEVDAGKFTVMVHLLHKANIDDSPVRRTEMGSNKGSRRFATCQRGSSCLRRITAKIATTSSSSEETGEESPLESHPFESDDYQIPSRPDHGLSLGSCLSGSQYEKVVALIQKIQPKTAVFVALMRQCDIQLPSPLLIISKEHAVAFFPDGSEIITLQRPDKNKKWHPRFYLTTDGSASTSMLAGHWLDFICDNRVLEGDICIFVPEKGGNRFKFTVHLVRGERNPLKRGTGGTQRVSSSHGRRNTKIASAVHFKDKPTYGANISSESNSHGLHEESPENEDSDGPSEPNYIVPNQSRLSPYQKKVVAKKVQALNSKVPIYVVIVKKGNVGMKRMLELSSLYAAAAHLPRKGQTLVLQCLGQMWETNMHLFGNGKRYFVKEGWLKFFHDNSLQVGDICLFELKKNKKELTMVVHIIRDER